MKLAILVVTHKPCWVPDTPPYLPVWVGSAAEKPHGIVHQHNEGENIADRNESYCELTALYWAWKNLLDAEYIGLSHYRRYFAERSLGGAPNDRIMSEGQYQRILDKHSLIVPKQRHYWIETNWSQYAHAHHVEDLALARAIIAQKHPAYVQAFDAVMKRTHGHRFNMFVMRRDLLEAYCAWLFDILFELEARLDISAYNANDRRVFGFVGERLLDVWLQRSGIDYHEAPVLMTEAENWPRKITAFVGRKFAARK